jgi:ATP-dependent DNA ligase
MEMEGIMIKDIHAKYTEGKRSDAWLKLKYRSEARCAILGYTAGEGDRSGYFGSLHIAQIVEDELLYRGRVGTGFDGKMLKAFKKFFDILPKGSKWIKDKVDEESRTTWFVDKFPVCEIQYAKMTGNNTFREPVFKKMEDNLYEI